jgi:hypothetical protein
MKHKLTLRIVWFILLVIFVLALYGLFLWAITFLGSHAQNGESSSLHSDNIVTSTLSQSAYLVTNKTAAYQFTLSRGWYLEEGAGSGITVYPDYDPAGTTAPSCKIEISALPNPGNVVLTDWLTAHFQEDPTVDIEQRSVTAMDVPGHSAILWSGLENGASTTLAYIAGSHVVYEIAPSLIEKSGLVAAGAVDDCVDDLQSLIGTFKPNR